MRRRLSNSPSPSRRSPSAIRLQSGPDTQARIAVFRAETGEWFLRRDDGAALIDSVHHLGEKGDIPVPGRYYHPADFGRGFLAIFHPSTDSTVPSGCDTGSARWNWVLPNQLASISYVPLGIQGDLPVPADYGVGSRGGSQVAVFRPSTAEWIIQREPFISCSIKDINGAVTVDNGTTAIRFPATPTPGDIPVPAPYFAPGDHAQPAVFRPGTGEWFLRSDDGSSVRVPWGTYGDIPVPADYLGLKHAQIAVYRPSTGEWFIRNDNGQATRIPFGGQGDRLVPGDYLGLGSAQLAVFRPTTAEWFILPPDGQEPIRVQWGAPTDQPVPAAYGHLPHK